MAFGDNGQRKKTGFEKLTLIVVVIMLLVTVGAIFASALGGLIQIAMKNGQITYSSRRYLKVIKEKLQL